MAQTSAEKKQTNEITSENRRSFLAILTGAFTMLIPLGVGVAAFLTPLFRKRKTPQVRIALLDQVPDDGLPRYFPVITDREDAWNRYDEQRIGAVYLVRDPGEKVPTAFSAKCPHAGCFIGYSLGESEFKCPCHTSSFNLDGTRVRGDDEVSPRGMDELPVELRTIEIAEDRTASEVWVEYIDFQTGHSERHPVA